MNFNSKSVLVIDDYPTLVRIISRMMHELEFARVDGAKDGEEGLCKLRDYSYDFVVCDFSMEGVTGLDVLMACKREPDLQRTAIIMVGNDMQAKAAKMAHADGFIAKPFNVHILKSTLEAVAARRSPQESETP